GHGHAVSAKILVARQHNVGAARERFAADGVEAAAAHDDRLAKRRSPEMFEVARQVPGHAAVAADDAVRGNGGDENETRRLHFLRNLSRRTTCAPPLSSDGGTGSSITGRPPLRVEG